MKKLLFSIVALTLTTGIFAQKKSDDVAKIKSETIDLGKIKQDVPTPAVFEVINIGTEDLLIEQANPTCGCTIGEYTKDKIAPGKSGTIKATYNAKNIGMFEKHLTVKFAGCDDMKSITIKGEVIKNEIAHTTKHKVLDDYLLENTKKCLFVPNFTKGIASNSEFKMRFTFKLED